MYHTRAIPAKKQLSKELSILNDPYFQSRRPHLLAMIDKLQRARTRADVRALHIELIAEKGALENIVPELDEEYGAAAREQRRTLGKVEPKTPEIKNALKEANERIRRIDHMHVVAGALRHVARVIADGLAWRVFDFDRTALSVLANREVVGNYAPPAGFEEEMRAMDRLEQALNTIVVHNDTTYCLRHGDITAVVEIDGRRFPYAEEVKAGRSQAVRQRQAIKEATRRIFEDRLLVPVAFATHLRQLLPMIANAKATGYAEEKIDCRFVQIIDYRHFGGREDEVGRLIEDADARLGWFGDDRLILAGISGAARIHDRGEPVAEIAPMSIFPLPHDHVVDLLMGAIDLRVHLNTQLLALEFAKHGIQVEFARGPNAGRHFLYAKRGYLGLTVPAYVREQMLAELLDSTALIELVKWIFDRGLTVEWAKTGDTPIIAFADERPAWSGGADQIELAA